MGYCSRHVPNSSIRSLVFLVISRRAPAEWTTAKENMLVSQFVFSVQEAIVAIGVNVVARVCCWRHDQATPLECLVHGDARGEPHDAECTGATNNAGWRMEDGGWRMEGDF